MSGPRRRLTEAQLDELAALREQGKTLKWLANHALLNWGVGIHPNAVSWQMLRIGADLPSTRWQRPLIGPREVTRGNHLVRRYTPAEDEQLLDLEAAGLNDSEIGRRIGRKANSVRGRLMTLARHDARQEELA